MAANPWEPFEKILESVKAATEALGIEPLDWVLLPGHDGGACQIAFKVREDAFLDDESKQIRRQLDEMLVGQREAEREEQAAKETEAARNRLIQISKNGIFAEDDDDSGGK